MKSTNTHTRINRCKHTGKYQTLTAFRGHVRLWAARVLTTIGYGWFCLCCGKFSVAVFLFRSYIISGLNVHGVRNKDCNLRVSLTSCFAPHTDCNVFPFWICNPQSWQKHSNYNVWCLWDSNWVILKLLLKPVFMSASLSQMRHC